MRVLTRYIILILIIWLFCANAYGDGRMYFYFDRVPVDIPYQRAFLVYNEGIETLILQSKYEFSQTKDVNEIGWIVPVPSVPEIASADADKAFLFFFHTSIGTQPKTIQIKLIPYFILVFILLASLVLFILFILLYPFLRIIGMSNTTWNHWNSLFARAGTITFFILLFFGLFGLFMPALSKSGDVEVVNAQKAGIYDVKVIKGDTAQGIMDWLNENQFKFSEKDREAFSDYVNSKWCYVTAKVRQDIEVQNENISNRGLVAPLILKFKSDKAIYPLALTSVIGTQTEVLLYTLSQNKLSCNERMTLRYSKTIKTKGLFDSLLSYDQTDTKSIFNNLPEEMTICKFKEKLTSEQMKEDLEFKDALNNEPYKETKIVW